MLDHSGTVSRIMVAGFPRRGHSGAELFMVIVWGLDQFACESLYNASSQEFPRCSRMQNAECSRIALSRSVRSSAFPAFRACVVNQHVFPLAGLDLGSCG